MRQERTLPALVLHALERGAHRCAEQLVANIVLTGAISVDSALCGRAGLFWVLSLLLVGLS